MAGAVSPQRAGGGVSAIGSFGFWVCFAFRASHFGFPMEREDHEEAERAKEGPETEAGGQGRSGREAVGGAAAGQRARAAGGSVD